ncbi:hypothetical protein K435DRAFT_868111 [Dendrothele bispora CBS 962.96]|uniref:Uncharacterized protein n=1 Tax=Dendrothele bispora (strain CBS 962.96) TaxID=1314807 RepID=A0A4S8LD99_DENBC|nr:hypothetical protein K435DRAFT_868111 [Dendrothele bispora CBS 962.96]
MNQEEQENWKISNIYCFHQNPEYCWLNLFIDSPQDFKIRSPTELLQVSALLDLSLDQEILDLAGLSYNNISGSDRENSMFDDSNDVKLFSMASIESLDYYNESLTENMSQEQAKIDAQFEDGPKAWATKIAAIENVVKKGETYLFMNKISIDDEFMGCYQGWKSSYGQ